MLKAPQILESCLKISGATPSPHPKNHCTDKSSRYHRNLHQSAGDGQYYACIITTRRNNNTMPNLRIIIPRACRWIASTQRYCWTTPTYPLTLSRIHLSLHICIYTHKQIYIYIYLSTCPVYSPLFVYLVRSRVTWRVYGAYNVAFEQCEELAAHYNRRVLYRMSRAAHTMSPTKAVCSTLRFAPTHTQKSSADIAECMRASLQFPDMPVACTRLALGAPCARNMFVPSSRISR